MDFDLDEAIPILERTPATLSTLLDELPEDWTTVNEGPDTWSPREVVGHLIHGDRRLRIHDLGAHVTAHRHTSTGGEQREQRNEPFHTSLLS